MAVYLKNGSIFKVTNGIDLDLHERLPADNFIIRVTQEGYVLQQTEGFKLPSRIYGNALTHTDRILNTFQKRSGSTGVLLSGEKGSGKTLLAKNISIEAAKLDVPTIVINNALVGDSFNKLIQEIDQPCVVMFDEFEKVYNSQNQELVLTLLDGVYNSKKLFVFTCNDKYRIDANMKNRPGRIFYSLDYKGLEDSVIVEYCKDHLQEMKHMDYICKLPTLIDPFNFDMLQSLVEEVNRYKETPQEALNLLNIKPAYTDNLTFDVTVKRDDQPIEVEQSDRRWHGNPFNSNLVLEIITNAAEDQGEVLECSPEDLVIKPHGIYLYEVDGYTVELQKIKKKNYSHIGKL